ncbi:alkaline phosphatase family protein [Tardiphaga sp. vice352]|uniref:alkaline phosphatase family protein n=1 Tax=unclassified Tardiphaga TaxID=2631404 RepID=UPI001164F1B0|nr:MULTISPECIES: alkaline phosphatase family protein [unclassified Tardiphaga]QDM17105.1 alkaline phosphatase family protein [Tardiphaga sp. vice278]QDM22085.1 alkaline phosphatase family protein [Tardiphaga sp. vice154]QDM27339.1 alkaline phosphatase family protein [Tardiphaga sp. vice304]QDM32465.1 alkaline phosphatase family protein [Tardiphaga sp. vice352]
MSHPIVVTMICDGHRPDFVSEATTPQMARLRQAGTWFADHRGIFPSATRASSASIATGCWPVSHGLRGNSVALPSAGGHHVHDAGMPEFFDTYRQHFGRLLMRPSLSARVSGLHGALLCSNVSPGAAWFHDADGHAELYHRELSYRPGREPLPAIDAPAGAKGDAVLTEQFITTLLERPPSVATLWLSEPDKTMHAFPLGSPQHLAALRVVDGHVGAVAEAVERLRDRGHEVLLMVGSDHGHESVTETVPVERRLFEAGFKAELESPDVVVACQGTSAFIHFGGDALARRDEVADWLGQQSWAGRIMRGEDLAALGQIPASDVLALDMAKSPGSNRNGVPGLTAMAVRFSETEDAVRRDCGMHGGLGRYETNPTLIAVGNGFAAGSVVTMQSRIIDLAPTALRHLGLPQDGLDGVALVASPG